MENPELEQVGFKTGILFIVFNRLDVTRQVFKTIKNIKPERLYIASDGARPTVDADFLKVKETREYLLSNIDWQCDVKTLFRETNFGCGNNVKLAIDWFFENEEYGIILEDDCLPTPSFFQFTEILLKQYADDQRVGMISGSNHLTNYYTMEDSYLFSKSQTTWGWATWKRSWKNMDLEMSWLKTSKKAAIIKNISYSRLSHSHWKNCINKVENKITDSWDWQWFFSLSFQNQLTIFPAKNLISNLGFIKEATHTTGKPKKSYLEVENIDFPLSHPKYVLADPKFDAIFEKKKLSRQIIMGLFSPFIKNKVKSFFTKD